MWDGNFPIDNINVTVAFYGNMRMQDLTGHRYGRLVVAYHCRVNGKIGCMCVCQCGNSIKVSSNDLRTGNTKSCGCWLREWAVIVGKTRNIKHGMFASREYYSYQSAKPRCLNPMDKDYKNYGGRGIKFLFKDFQEFYTELGPKPKGLVLDRIENNGHYEVGNVRWVTPKVSRANQRLRSDSNG